MLTLGSMAMVLSSGFVVGLPLLWLRRREPLTEADWLLAPFVGLAAILLVLHNLIYADVTVAQCTPWIWAGALVLWSGLLLKHGVKPLLSHVPAPVLLAMAAVYALQGLGLLLAGVEAYLGRAWGDQYNYTVTAQFLSDFPHSLSWDSIGQRPFLVEASTFKDDRIGVMLLQGFLARSLGTEAKNLFEPAILLGPALVVPATYGLAGRLGLGRRAALAAAGGAGVLPGLTILHLDGFLSQVVALPFLLCLLSALHDLIGSVRPAAVLVAGGLLAATAALYTEFLPFLLLLILLFAIGGMVVGAVRPLPGVLILLALPLLLAGLNPMYTASIPSILARLTMSTAARNAMGFGWASGFSALWVRDCGLLERAPWKELGVAAGLGLTATSVLGLLRPGAAGLDRPTVRDRCGPPGAGPPAAGAGRGGAGAGAGGTPAHRGPASLPVHQAASFCGAPAGRRPGGLGTPSGPAGRPRDLLASPPGRTTAAGGCGPPRPLRHHYTAPANGVVSRPGTRSSPDAGPGTNRGPPGPRTPAGAAGGPGVRPGPARQLLAGVRRTP